MCEAQLNTLSQLAFFFAAGIKKKEKNLHLCVHFSQLENIYQLVNQQSKFLKR